MDHHGKSPRSSFVDEIVVTLEERIRLNVEPNNNGADKRKHGSKDTDTGLQGSVENRCKIVYELYADHVTLYTTLQVW
jgi:hypothetical protein